MPRKEPSRCAPGESATNELDTIETLRAVTWKRRTEYAEQVRDKHGMLEYAQRIATAPGHPTVCIRELKPGRSSPRSLAEADIEGGPGSASKPKPYHGYYFRVLHAQGPYAEGGRHNYMVKDSMIGGFGLVAWPAHYGVSGVHTFIVNQDGLVYEKDMGNPANSLSTTVSSYNPDKSWMRVE